MHILILEALGLLAWLLVGFLVAVAFGSVAREGAGMYGEPSPKPQPVRGLRLVPAEAPVIETATRRLTEIRPANAWSAREFEIIPPAPWPVSGRRGRDGRVPQFEAVKTFKEIVGKGQGKDYPTSN
jgi:hypothetical protein